MAPKRSLRGLAINALLLIIGLALLWGSRAEIRRVLARPFDGRLAAAAFGVYMTGLVITFLRWYLLVRALGLPFHVRDAVRLGFIGNFFNLMIPGAVGGDLIKAGFLYREQARKTQAMGSMVIDRIIGLLGLFLLAALAGAVAWPQAGAVVRRLVLIVWAAAALGGLGLVVLFTPALYRPLEWLLARRRRLEVVLVELVAMAGLYRRRLGVVVAALLMAMTNHALNVLAFYLASRAMFSAGSLPGLGAHYLMVPLVLFTTAAPLPGGALGLSEKISGQLFALVRHPSGVEAMLGFRGVMYAGCLVSLLIYLLNARQVRALRQPGPPPEAELAD
jgi:uncharacterized membrane protein YbhN (UPF0104 family)